MNDIPKFATQPFVGLLLKTFFFATKMKARVSDAVAAMHWNAVIDLSGYPIWM